MNEADSGPQLAVPSGVADSMVALRLRLAKLRGKVRMPARIWHQRGLDALRSGLKGRLGMAQLRDLQRVTFALFDWNPTLFDQDATTVLTWCDAHVEAPPRLPVLLLRLQHQYDQLCDLCVLEWANLITRLSPEIPEVVVRDWLNLLVVESKEDDAVATEWFSYLAASGAVESVALGIAVGDLEFLEAIAQGLLYCPTSAIGQPAVPRVAGPQEEDLRARDEEKKKGIERAINALATIEEQGAAKEVEGAIPETPPPDGIQYKPPSHAVTSAARASAEPTYEQLLDTLETGYDNVREANLDMPVLEEAAPTEPAVYGGAVGDERSQLQRIAEDALEPWQSGLEKKAETPASLKIGKTPENVSQDEDKSIASPLDIKGIPARIILACALVLVAIGIAYYLLCPVAGDYVDRHEFKSEHPVAPVVSSPEPARPPNERTAIPPAAVASSVRKSVDDSVSSPFIQAYGPESSSRTRGVFLLVTAIFIALFDLYMLTCWNKGDQEEQTSMPTVSKKGLGS